MHFSRAARPIVFFFVSLLATPAFAEPPGSASADVADLKEQLEKGLKARRPEEFAFIAKVVTMVNQNRLPLSIVKGSFFFVRKKYQSKKYLVPYFERVLRAHAAREGIRV